jgi:hypothetical protein
MVRIQPVPADCMLGCSMPVRNSSSKCSETLRTWRAEVHSLHVRGANCCEGAVGTHPCGGPYKRTQLRRPNQRRADGLREACIWASGAPE